MTYETVPVSILDVLTGRVELKKSGAFHSGPCPVCGGKDRFVVKNDEVWLCRHCSPGYRNVIALYMELHNLPFGAAMDELKRGGIRPVTVVQQDPPSIYPDPDWEKMARDVATESHKHLMSPEGARARAWLNNERKLDNLFISMFQLGFSEDRPELGVPKSITIPWTFGNRMMKLKFRLPVPKLMTGKKKTTSYFHLSGSKHSVFNINRAVGAHTIIMVEGELDAILMQQTIDMALVNKGFAVLAAGSNANLVKPEFWDFAFTNARVLVAYDSDKPGQDATKEFIKNHPTALAMSPLSEKDFTEAHIKNETEAIRWLTQILK